MLLRLRLRTAARRLTDHGWPVTPGHISTANAWRATGRPAGRPAATRCLPDWAVQMAIRRDWWADHPHAVLLPTGQALRCHRGARAAGRQGQRDLRPGSPMPARRWVFFVRSGSTLRTELDHRTEIVQHAPARGSRPRRRCSPKARCAGIYPRTGRVEAARPSEVQRAMLDGLVALDASFLDLPLNVAPARLHPSLHSGDRRSPRCIVASVAAELVSRGEGAST